MINIARREVIACWRKGVARDQRHSVDVVSARDDSTLGLRSTLNRTTTTEVHNILNARLMMPLAVHVS